MPSARQEKRYSAAAGTGLVVVCEGTADAALKQGGELLGDLDSGANNVADAVTAGVNGDIPGAISSGLSATMDGATAFSRSVVTAGATAGTGVIVGIAGIGTAVGQLGSWSFRSAWSWITSMQEPFIEPSPGYIYRPPTDDEVDEAAEKALKRSTKASCLRDRASILEVDRTIPGLGTASWNFLHAGMKQLMITLRLGATEDRPVEVHPDLVGARAQFVRAANAFACYVAYPKSYIPDPQKELDVAKKSLQQLAELAQHFVHAEGVRSAVRETLGHRAVGSSLPTTEGPKRKFSHHRRR